MPQFQHHVSLAPHVLDAIPTDDFKKLLIPSLHHDMGSLISGTLLIIAPDTSGSKESSVEQICSQCFINGYLWQKCTQSRTKGS